MSFVARVVTRPTYAASPPCDSWAPDAPQRLSVPTVTAQVCGPTPDGPEAGNRPQPPSRRRARQRPLLPATGSRGPQTAAEPQFGWTKTATVRAGTVRTPLPASYADCLTTLSAPFACTGLSRTWPERP